MSEERIKLAGRNGGGTVVTAVLFDLYETLVTEAGTKPTRASSLGPVLGLEDAEFRAEWKRQRLKVVLGQLSFRVALANISKNLSGSVDEKAIQSVCELRIEEKAAVLAAVDQDVEAIVDTLYSHGHCLGVISNCFAEDVAAWPSCSLSSKFQCTAFSYEVGFAKPDSEIYLGAIRRLGVGSESTVFIGDGADDELAGAERAGLRSFRAGWFVGRRSNLVNVQNDRELKRCADVLRVLSAG